MCAKKLEGSKQLSVVLRTYDSYHSLLYGIIFKICKNTSLSENILLETFNTYFKKNDVDNDNSPAFTDLLKLTIHIISNKTSQSKMSVANIILEAKRHKAAFLPDCSAVSML